MFSSIIFPACPVCYIPVEQAIASMPISPSISPVLRSLTYIHDENPIKSEPHGGSDFGGYPSLRQRNDSFNIKESMTVHCGYVSLSYLFSCTNLICNDDYFSKDLNFDSHHSCNLSS